MPAYETDGFEPPAPVARAFVRGPNPGVYRDLPLLIDTGAEVSVIPRLAAEAVGADIRPSGIVLRFYDGSETRLEVADVELEFLRYRFRGSFLVADATYGIVGRNILNLLVLTLDGPSLTWSA
jgi:predicted aspartyl protease